MNELERGERKILSTSTETAEDRIVNLLRDDVMCCKNCGSSIGWTRPNWDNMHECLRCKYEKEGS